MFKGSIPAVITPFDGNEVDYESLVKVLNHLIKLNLDHVFLNIFILPDRIVFLTEFVLMNIEKD